MVGTMVDALVSTCLAKLGALMEEEVVRTLAVRKDIKRLRKKLIYFSSVRENAEAQAMEDSGAETWYRDLKHLMFDIEDIIDLTMVNSRNQASSVCCNCTLFSRFSELPSHHRIARRIKDVNEQLDEMKKNKEIISSHQSSQPFRITSVNRSQTSPTSEPDFVGEEMKQAVGTMVQRIISDLHDCRPYVLGIYGMGGIGKTTLAQKIYNEQAIKGKFEVRIWLCVSQSYTETGLLKHAIRMAGGKCDQLEMKAELLEVLGNSIRGKRVFLVLDDVHKSDVWVNLLRLPLECTMISSRVLVTTRYLDVLERMHAIHCHQVNKMGICDGLELLLRKSLRAGIETSEFSEIGEEIVKKCDGLPLAIEVIAGVLSTKRSRVEWESIRDRKWSTHGLPEEVHGSLFLSYNDLHPQLKQCFLWCALLPPNFDIRRDDVIYWWVAEGFVREEYGRSIYEIAEEYYLELIRRILLQPKPDSVDKGVSRMHDLLRSLAQNLTRDHALFLSKDSDEHMWRDHGFFKSVEKKEDELLKLRRLGISNDVEEIPAIENEIGLRRLLLFHSYNLRELKNSFFIGFEHLRVIVFRGINIRRIPDTIGRLVQLRLLDLSYTKVEQLPESMGGLFSLEYFSAVGCLQLGSLPASLMDLSRLRFFQVDKALTSIPRGIGKFQHLYNLKGVFENGTAGFTLDELQNLSKIRHLWIEKLEKAMPRSTMVLSSMVHLKELGLSCTMDADPNNRTHYQTEQIERIQRVHEKLVPSRKLECIFFYGFPGVRLPGWLCSEPQDKLPHLGHMHFNECIAFSELPPAGQLPELQVLHVKGADAIRNTGAELPGKGVRMTLGSSTKVFPKLELIHISDMPNWETWSLSTVGLCSQDTTGDSHQVTLMPLKRVSLLHCPKLRALPEGLHRAANLREVRIEGAHSLHEIVNLPVVVLLKVKHNRGLRRIANLPKLEDLFVQDCPALDQAENLGKLKRLGIVGCAKAEQFRRCLLEEERALVILFFFGYTCPCFFSPLSPPYLGLIISNMLMVHDG